MDDLKVFDSPDKISVSTVKKNSILTNNESFRSDNFGPKGFFSMFSKMKKSDEIDNDLMINETVVHAIDTDTVTSVNSDIIEPQIIDSSLIVNDPTIFDIKSEKNVAEKFKNSNNSYVDMHKDSINKNHGLFDKLTKSLKDTSFSKIFSNKNNKIAAGLVILAIVLVMFLNLSKGQEVSKQSTNFNNVDYVSSKVYIDNLEANLTSTLSRIKGAGNVKVMVTLESGPELKIANSVDERTTTTTSSGSTSTTNINVIKNPILITQNGKTSPLILMEIMPKIKGVIVVAQGANNTKVKLELLQAVQALLEVPNNNIQIYSGI